MARSRSRPRRYAERGASVAAALPPGPPEPQQKQKAEGRERPWLPWAIGGGLLAAGVLVGWASPLLLFRPIISKSAPVAKAPQPAGVTGPAAAEVPEAMPALDAAPGEQVELTWTVRNKGAAVWTTYGYSFLPVQGYSAPVISLPKAVAPGSDVAVRVLVTAPAESGAWAPVWELRGPGGPVPGGRLSASVRVSAERKAPGPVTPTPPAGPIPAPYPGQPAVLPPQPAPPPPAPRPEPPPANP